MKENEPVRVQRQQAPDTFLKCISDKAHKTQSNERMAEKMTISVISLFYVLLILTCTDMELVQAGENVLRTSQSQSAKRFLMLNSDFNATETFKKFPGVIRLRNVFTSNPDFPFCTGIFIHENYIVTAGGCIAPSVQIPEEDGFFWTNETSPPAPPIQVEAMDSEGSVTVVADLRAVQFHNVPSEGFNLAIILVERRPAVSSVKILSYGIQRVNYDIPRSAVVSSIGHTDTDVNQDGEEIIAGPVRHLAANIMINGLGRSSEREGVCASQFVAGTLVYQRKDIRDQEEEVNRAAVCIVFGERGAPVLIRPQTGENIWPKQPGKTNTEFVLAGVVIEERNKQGVCSDTSTRVTNAVFQIRWIERSIRRFETWAASNALPVESIESQFDICPSATPTRTTRPTATSTPSPSTTITASPSSPPPSPSDPGIDWIVIGSFSGAVFLFIFCSFVLYCKWKHALKRHREKAIIRSKIFKESLHKNMEGKILSIQDQIGEEDELKARVENAEADRLKKQSEFLPPKSKSERRKQRDAKILEQQRKKRLRQVQLESTRHGKDRMVNFGSPGVGRFSTITEEQKRQYLSSQNRTTSRNQLQFEPSQSLEGNSDEALPGTSHPN